MIERVGVVADVDFLQMQTVSEARHWFDSHAMQFQEAQALIVQTCGDIDDIRRQHDAVDNDAERAVCLKAIDALKRTCDLRKFATLPDGTDIYRQRIRNAAITLLGQRVAKALVEADRRERECLDSQFKHTS